MKMDTRGKIALVLSVSVISGGASWLIFKPATNERTSDQIYGAMGKSIGVDEVFWKKVGVVLDKATSNDNVKLTPSEYDLLYKALGTGNPNAQKPALMALERCPPENTAECFKKAEEVARKSEDPDLQTWAYGLMWNLAPDKHPYIREIAKLSKFSEVGEEVRNWPEKLTKK